MILLLRVATGFLLVGWGWHYVFYPPPWGGRGEAWLLIGILLGLGGLALWLCPARYRPGLSGLTLLAVPVLLAQALASAARTQWEVAQVIEHSLQWTTPLWLWLALWRPTSRAWPWGVRVAIALTFAGHGLYALGWPHGLPGHFLAMTQQILGLSDAGAIWYLRMAGVLDLIVAVGIFWPRLIRPLLLYATIWGLLTALARPLAFVEVATLGPDLNRWLPELLLRLPHSLVPLALYRGAVAAERAAQ